MSHLFLISNHHLKGVMGYTLYHERDTKRVIAAVPQLSGDLFFHLFILFLFSSVGGAIQRTAF